MHCRLLILVLAALACAGQRRGAWALENGTGAHTICTAAWDPMVVCDPTQPQDSYTGFDVEMFRAAAAQLGWAEGIDYNWKCWEDWDGMMSDLTAGGEEGVGGICMAAAAGLTVSTEREKAGIEFTYPSYRSSLGVLVSASVRGGDGWGFIRPFDWTVWLAVALTVLAFPFIAFLIEFLSVKGRIERSEVLPGYKESAVRGMWTMLLLEPFHLSSFGARVTALCYGFLATILVNTYCANLAAALTVTSINSQIRSVADLRGKAVGTEEFYSDRLRNKYGIFATSPYFENYQADLAAAVRSGELAAWVTDEPLVQYIAATDKQCGLGVLSETIEPFDYAIAFRKGSPRELVDTFSEAVLKLQEDGVLSQLRDSYITVQQDGCGTSGEVNQDTSSIKFGDVWGLWVILGAGIFVGMLFTLLAMRKHATARKRHAALPYNKSMGRQSSGVIDEGSTHGGAAHHGGPLPTDADQSRPLVSFLRTAMRRSMSVGRRKSSKSWRRADTARAAAVEAAVAEATAEDARRRRTVSFAAGAGAAAAQQNGGDSGEAGDLEQGSLGSVGPGREDSASLPTPAELFLRRQSELEENSGLFREGWREVAKSTVFGGEEARKGKPVFPEHMLTGKPARGAASASGSP